MISAIASALVPIIFVVLLGGLAGWMRIFKSEDAGVLASFTVRFALPLSLAISAAKASPKDITDLGYVTCLAVGLMGTYAIGFLIGWRIERQDVASSAMRGLVCSFPNMAYCGPPVLLVAVGPNGILSVVIGNLITTLVIVPLTIVLAHAGNARGSGSQVGQALKSLGGAIRQPLVWVPFLGMLAALFGVRMPALMESALDEIGRASGGVALFTLGLILYGQTPKLDRDIFINVAVKNIVQPALIIATALAVGLSGNLLKEVFLIGVLPAATAVPALALRTQVYANEAATSVMASTFFALVTISAGIVIASLL